MAMAMTDKEFIELERRFWQAMKERDAKTCMDLTDSSCIVSGPQGVSSFERKALGKMLEEGPMIEDFKLKDGAKISRLGEDVAVIAYEVHEDLKVEGRPISLDASECSTWVRRDGRWVCAQHSEAISGDPFGRDRVPAPPYVSPYAGEEAWGSE